MILLSHHKVQQLLFVACLADQYSVTVSSCSDPGHKSMVSRRQKYLLVQLPNAREELWQILFVSMVSSYPGCLLFLLGLRLSCECSCGRG